MRIIPQLVLLAAACFVLSANAQIRGRVVGVTDGDTLTALDSQSRQIKVRLAGIDAPEKGQDFGNRAKQFLSSQVFNRDIQLVGNKIDRYGRLVAKVVIDGRDVNLELVRAGYAWHFKQYENEQTLSDRSLYASAEVEARRARLNLWSFPNPTPPWEFRHPEKAPSAVRVFTGFTVIGNKRSGIYHYTGCPDMLKIAERNREYFKTREDAQRAGYRVAKNCP